MEDKYFIISCNEDGEISVREWNKRKLQENLDEGEWFEGQNFPAPSIPFCTDPQSWGNDVMLIKGRRIQPQPKEKVIEYEVE